MRVWWRGDQLRIQGRQRRVASDVWIRANTASSTRHAGAAQGEDHGADDTVGHGDHRRVVGPAAAAPRRPGGRRTAACDSTLPLSTSGPAMSGTTTAAERRRQGVGGLGDDRPGDFVAAAPSASNTSGAKRASSTGRSPVDGIDELLEGSRATAVGPARCPSIPSWSSTRSTRAVGGPRPSSGAARREHRTMADPETGAAVTEQPAEAVARRLDPAAADAYGGRSGAGDEGVAVRWRASPSGRRRAGRVPASAAPAARR